MNLKLKCNKLLERVDFSLEKINSLENANSALKEDNHKFNKTIRYQKNLIGGPFIIYEKIL